jgi:hypothetical protein
LILLNLKICVKNTTGDFYFLPGDELIYLFDSPASLMRDRPPIILDKWRIVNINDCPHIGEINKRGKHTLPSIALHWTVGEYQAYHPQRWPTYTAEDFELDKQFIDNENYITESYIHDCFDKHLNHITIKI